MNRDKTLTTQTIWQILDTIPDPEIPVISMVELGIIQEVTLHANDAVQIIITPTFSGCPAMSIMQENIIEALSAEGIDEVTIKIVLDPPWTSDRIGEDARRKMAEFGIAPPHLLHGRGDGATIMLMEAVECPFCHSTHTRLESPFGPTLCRAIYYCHTCQQPFELFKPL